MSTTTCYNDIERGIRFHARLSPSPMYKNDKSNNVEPRTQLQCIKCL